MGMFYFLAACAMLVFGYLVYGVIVERIFGIDPDRKTPVETRADGVDYVPLPAYKIFFIQLLNIAGLGPVFGPILGALYGPAALLWVVFGSIFAGAVHDFLAGAMSLRYNGASYPDVIGRNLGPYVRWFLLIFTIWFMILVGAVFVNGPAGLLAFKTSQFLQGTSFADTLVHCVENTFLQDFCLDAQGNIALSKILVIAFSVLIFLYYFLATILPIDKIIGHIYPLFAFLLLFMAVGLFVALILNPNYHILPNVQFKDFFINHHPNGLPMWPLIFVTIACGAISGFHATQSPMMARCMRSEKQARPIFYGVMIAEGVIGLLWVTIGLSFYGGDPSALLAAGKPAVVVSQTSEGLLGGVFGGTLVFLGVVILPISTGDTAFRTGRLILADMIQWNQSSIRHRILLAIPIFSLGIYFAVGEFQAIWMAFGWTNQTLACVTLWAAAVWLRRRRRFAWIAVVPALFMTTVCGTYLFCYSNFPFKWNVLPATCMGICISLAAFFLFLKQGSHMPEGDEKEF